MSSIVLACLLLVFAVAYIAWMHHTIRCMGRPRTPLTRGRALFLVLFGMVLVPTLTSAAIRLIETR